MTREEAIEILTMLRCQDTRVEADEYEQALEAAIKALSQEPCDDAISREFMELVVEYPPADLCTYPEYKGKPYYSIKYYENGEEFIGYGTYKPKVLSQYLKEYFIPSVTQKSGKWIHFAQSDDCSLCGFSTGKYGSPSKYCPDCGAKMVEPQESEDEE